MIESNWSVDLEGGGGERRRTLGVLEGDLQLLIGLADAAELVDEVHVPRGSAELAVRCALKPKIFLHPHGVTNRTILRFA